ARHIMHLPISDEDRACNSLARHIGKGFLKRAEKRGARFILRIVARGDDTNFNAVLARKSFVDALKRGTGFIGARSDFLTLASVHHDGSDVRHYLALFVADGRIEQHERQKGRRRHTPRRAARAAKRGIGEKPRRRQRKSEDQRERKKRFK